MDLTSKPLAYLKQMRLAKCYQIVIKPFHKISQTSINIEVFDFLLLFELNMKNSRDNRIASDVIKNAREVLAMAKHGTKVIFSNVFKIYDALE